MSPSRDIDTVRFDPALLPQRRREAIAARGQLLQDVAEGRLSAWEAIMVATIDDRPALRKIRIDQIVMTQPGIGEFRARKVVDQILTILGIPAGTFSVRDVTIGFVLDTRSGGRRILAVIDAFLSYGIIRTDSELSVWPGFPYSPSPLGTRKVR